MKSRLKQATSQIAFVSLLAIGSKSVFSQENLTFHLKAEKALLSHFLQNGGKIEFVQLRKNGSFLVNKSDFSLDLKSKNDKLTVQVSQSGESDIQFVITTGSIYRFFIKINNKLTEIHLSTEFTMSAQPCPDVPQVILNWKYISVDGKEHVSHGHCSHYSSSIK